ncbi:GNAT family acetyltransferase [Sandaracinobacteroides hominis]|uniref:GNAT family acetyltransferase n=1 Tax=Sandaracinobacteroides hominis TaxID=2780086 RepID=UPI0018F634AA|nr:GNAT family acetyltransferase [Sandaracinobacteroides hominis]
MEVRLLDARQREAAAALWEACGLTRPWNDPRADFDRAASADNAAVLGFCEGPALLGTVMVGEDGHRGWVYYLAVAPAARGAGLGAQLMAAAEAWLQERGLPKLNLMVRTENKAVIAFYTAQGYALSEVTVLQKSL